VPIPPWLPGEISSAIADNHALPHVPAMKPRRDHKLRDTIAALGFQLRENLGVVLLMIGLTIVCVAGSAWVTGQYSGPRTEEAGQVVRFGGYDLDDGPRLLVIVRTDRGPVLQLRADAASLLRCRAGSRIRLIRRGAILTVSPLGCGPSPSRP
jgi:hypothetical protein